MSFHEKNGEMKWSEILGHLFTKVLMKFSEIIDKTTSRNEGEMKCDEMIEENTLLNDREMKWNEVTS